MAQRSRTCDRCSCSRRTTQTQTTCRLRIQPALSSARESTATDPLSPSSSDISVPERTALRPITVRSRLPSDSYKPPSSLQDHDRHDQQRTHYQPHQFRFSSDFSTIAHCQIADSQRQRQRLIHVVGRTRRISDDFAYGDEGRVWRQKVVSQTERRDLFDTLFVEVRSAVIREFGNSRTCPEITQRCVAFVGLSAYDFETVHVVALACLAGEFDCSSDWSTPLAKQNYRALGQEIRKLNRVNVVRIETD